MNCLQRVENYLNKHQVNYAVHRHPAAYTAVQVAANEQIPRHMMLKVVLAYADNQLVMLVVNANEMIQLSKMAAVLGVHDMRLADETNLMTAFPDCELGAMPPFGNPYHIPVYINAELAENDTIYFQAGSHSVSISMKFSDFVRLVKPQILPFRVVENKVFDYRV